MGKIVGEFPPTGQIQYMRAGDSMADSTEMLGEVLVKRDQGWRIEGDLPPVKTGTYYLLEDKSHRNSFPGRQDILWFEEHTYVPADSGGGKPSNTAIICVHELHGFMLDV